MNWKKLVPAVLLVLPLAAFSADTSQTKLNGWIADSMCARHGDGAPNPECVKKCIEGGAKAVLVEDDGKQIWTIENPETITAHYGRHVSIAGVKNEKDKTIRIGQVQLLPMEDQKKPHPAH